MLNARKFSAEFIGTFVLVFMGCGSAIFLGADTGVGHLPVALAFGLSIVAMAYAIGKISGCHINPAVSLSMLLNKKMSVIEFIGYVVSQVLGAIAAAGLLYGLLSMTGVYDLTNGLGSNGLAGVDGSIAAALIIEVILTFIFIFVILAVVSDNTKGNVAGIVIGLTLTFVHIVGIPLTGTSVNPARSLGPAIFARGDALANVWIFIAAPLAGAVLAVIVFRFLYPKKSK